MTTCVCRYDLVARGHCGACGKMFAVCLGCRLNRTANGCSCPVKTPHPDYPEEWS